MIQRLKGGVFQLIFADEAFPIKLVPDQFSLDFGGTSPVIIKVNIINQPDKPVLKEIYTISGIGEEKPLDFNKIQILNTFFLMKMNYRITS